MIPVLLDCQVRALGMLSDASSQVRAVAGQIQSEMTDYLDAISNAQHTSAPSHQRPFDLATAVEARRLAISVCMMLECPALDLERASQGAWF